MTDSLPEKMDTFQTVTSEAAQAKRRQQSLGTEIGRELATHVEAAVADTGTTVEAVDRSPADERFRFEARLDRAAMLATLADALPDGFALAGTNGDGSLTIEWTGSDREPTKRNADVILKAVIDEGVETDADGLITAVPTREDVRSRVETLGVDGEIAVERLDRLVRLDMVDIDDGSVYPDTNFSRR
jgi:hypothetical protein